MSRLYLQYKDYFMQYCNLCNISKQRYFALTLIMLRNARGGIERKPYAGENLLRAHMGLNSSSVCPSLCTNTANTTNNQIDTIKGAITFCLVCI